MRRHDDKYIEYLGNLVTLPETYLLEIGCGSGFRTQQLSEAGACVLAIDDNPNAVRKARERARENEFVLRRAVFANNSVFDLQVEDNTFEAAVFSFSFHHYRRLDMHAAIDQVLRFVTSEGEIAFFEPGVDGTLYEAELRFKSRTDDERIAKLCAYEVMRTHRGLKLVDELHYDEVFEFESLDDYLAAMKPKDTTGLEKYLEECHYRLNATRRLNVYRRAG